MGILVEPTSVNGNRIVAALNAFAFRELGLTPEDFAQEGNIIQLGYEPVRIDLITSVSGISFEAVWQNRVPGVYGQTPTHFISREHLIATKRAAGHPQDLLDIETRSASPPPPEKKQP